MRTIGKLLVFVCVAAMFYGCAAKVPTMKIDTYTGEKEQIYFAGVSFVGASADIKEKYPHSGILVKGQNYDDKTYNDTNYSKVINDLVVKLQPQYMNIILENGVLAGVATASKDKSVAVTLTIDRERVSFIPVASGGYKVVTQISGQIIALDVITSALISTTPVNVINIDYVKDTRSKSKYDFVKQVLLNDFTNAFKEKFINMQIKKAFNNRIKIGDVVLEQKSLKRINANEPSHEAYKSAVAGAFLQSLSDKTHVPFLPYAQDSVSNTIKLNISNKNYDLTIPPADYELNLTVQGYSVSLSEPKGAQRVATFITYFNITALVPSTEKKILNTNVVGIATSINPSSTRLEDLDVWTSLFDSVMVLSDGLAENIYSPTSKWLKYVSGKDADIGSVKKELIELSKILDKCR